MTRAILLRVQCFMSLTCNLHFSRRHSTLAESSCVITTLAYISRAQLYICQRECIQPQDVAEACWQHTRTSKETHQRAFRLHSCLQLLVGLGYTNLQLPLGSKHLEHRHIVPANVSCMVEFDYKCCILALLVQRIGQEAIGNFSRLSLQALSNAVSECSAPMNA